MQPITSCLGVVESHLDTGSTISLLFSTATLAVCADIIHTINYAYRTNRRKKYARICYQKQCYFTYFGTAVYFRIVSFQGPFRFSFQGIEWGGGDCVYKVNIRRPFYSFRYLLSSCRFENDLPLKFIVSIFMLCRHERKKP